MATVRHLIRWSLLARGAVAVVMAGAVAVVMAGAVIAGTGPAAAADPDAVGPVAPIPEPGVEYLPGRNDCSAISPGGVRISTTGPRLEDKRVVGSATVRTVDFVCGGGHTNVYMETKVCGFWGCSWKVRDDVERVHLPSNAIVNTEHVSMPVRKGSNSYRLRVEVVYYEADSEQNKAYVAGKGATYYSPVIRYRS